MRCPLIRFGDKIDLLMKMAKYSFACRDIGVNCDFKAEDDDKNALVGVAVEHAKTAHNVQQADDVLKQKISDAIKEQQPQPAPQAAAPQPQPKPEPQPQQPQQSAPSPEPQKPEQPQQPQ